MGSLMTRPVGAGVNRPSGVTPPDQAATIGVFVLDDHELVRRGLVDLISSVDGIEVVGEGGRATDAVSRIRDAHPQVALIDARLPDGSGIDVCRQLRSAMPDVRCLILTSYDDEDAVFAAVVAGAAGYVLKEVNGDHLIEAIRDVANGKMLLDPAVTARLLARMRDSRVSAQAASSLTPRDHEILFMIADGLTNRQIAERLCLAEKTVKNYVSALLKKLGMARRTQAAVYGADIRRNEGGSYAPPASTH